MKLPPANKDPLAGITGFPPLGAFTLASAARNLVALADGRVLFGDSNLNVYDAGNSRALAPMSFPDAVGKGIRFAPAPDGKKVYVAIPDADRLSAFDFKQNQVASLKPSSDISTLAVSPNGSTLVTGTFKGQVRIWNLFSLDGGAAMSASHGPRPVEMAVFSRDGEIAATASEKSIMLWNVRENKVIGALANGHQPTSMAFTPDGLKACWSPRPMACSRRRSIETRGRRSRPADPASSESRSRTQRTSRCCGPTKSSFTNGRR